jgi:hypothetical protein
MYKETSLCDFWGLVSVVLSALYSIRTCMNECTPEFEVFTADYGECRLIGCDAV